MFVRWLYVWLLSITIRVHNSFQSNRQLRQGVCLRIIFLCTGEKIVVKLQIPFLSPVWTSQPVKSEHIQILKGGCGDVYIHVLSVGLCTLWNCCSGLFLPHWPQKDLVTSLVNKVMEQLYDREVRFTPCNLPQWDVSCHWDLSGVEGQSSSPADEHWCSGCSLPALQPQHSPAGWEAQLAEGWQLQELTSSSPAEVDSVSLFILPFTFLVGCLWVLAYWEPESTNPVVCVPIGPNTWLCVSCPVFNIFYVFQRIWNEYYMLYYKLSCAKLTSLISLVCEHVWLDWYRSLAADLRFQIFKTLLLLT